MKNFCQYHFLKTEKVLKRVKEIVLGQPYDMIEPVKMVPLYDKK